MNSDRIEMRQVLRTDAEKMLSSISPSEATALPAEVLLHELLVHKVELEVQNEELQRANILLEEARDRYMDLYEFSPLGYITIDRKGLISEINLTAAAMLDVERTKLLNRRFAKHVAAADKDRWHRLFMNIMESTDTDKHEFDLEITRDGAAAFPARIDCLRVVLKSGSPILRLSLLDISKIRQDESQTRLAAIAFGAPYGMMITDANLNILRVNPAYSAITGDAETDVIGKKPRLLKSKLQNADFYAAMWESVHLTGGWKGEILSRHKKGKTNLARITLTAVKGTDDAITNYLITLSSLNANN
ncbi:MAG: PAS domain-containing protein [Gallionella sp.]